MSEEQEKPKRNPGFYWIKEHKDSPWTVAEFLGEYWLTLGSEYAHNDGFFAEIDENEILRKDG